MAHDADAVLLLKYRTGSERCLRFRRIEGPSGQSLGGPCALASPSAPDQDMLVFDITLKHLTCHCFRSVIRVFALKSLCELPYPVAPAGFTI